MSAVYVTKGLAALILVASGMFLPAEITSAGSEGHKLSQLQALWADMTRTLGAQATHADRYSDQGSSNDSESDLEPGAGDPSPESGYSHISKRYPSYPHYISIKYPFYIHVISLHIQRYPMSYPVIEDMVFPIEDI
jgi:hypothetical protein